MSSRSVPRVFVIDPDLNLRTWSARISSGSGDRSLGRPMGRRWLIPLGLAVAALSAAALILDLPPLASALASTLRSLGYDMTQPLLAGIVTQLGGRRAGQAMGLNVFILFTGFGIDSPLFGAIIPFGFGAAFAICSSVQMTLGLVAFLLFRAETASSAS